MHTQGPWHINSADGVAHNVGCYCIDAKVGGVSVAVADTVCYGDCESTEAANANLIASAPEMLAALEAIWNDCNAWMDGEMDSLSQSDLMQAFIATAEKAIVKAKGE